MATLAATPDDNKQQVPPFQISMTAASLLGGTLGGVAGVISGHPWDTLKVRLQSQNPLSPIYKGTIHCAQTIIKHEGFRGLFKGMTSPMVGVALVNSALFGVYGALLEWQTADNEVNEFGMRVPTLNQIFIAGTGSGMINALVSSPVELVKIQLQNQGVNLSGNAAPVASTGKGTSGTGVLFKGNLDCIKKIYRVRGVRGLFLGLPVTILRETPSYAAYFVSYDVFCRWLKPADASPYQELSGWRLMLASGMGGVAAWLSTYPTDVIKTIIQGDPRILQPKHKIIGAIGCMKMLYRQHGISSFFIGLTATVIRAFPTNMAILTTWQMSVNAMKSAGLISNAPPSHTYMEEEEEEEDSAAAENGIS